MATQEAEDFVLCCVVLCCVLCCVVLCVVLCCVVLCWVVLGCVVLCWVVLWIYVYTMQEQNEQWRHAMPWSNLNLFADATKGGLSLFNIGQ